MERDTNKKKPIPKSYIIFRELFSIGTWTYIFTKLFIFDLDVVLVSRFFSSFMWVIQYKALIFLSFAVTATLICSIGTLFKFSTYVFFYPVILLCWKFPTAVYKTGNWNFAIAIINSLFNSFKSFKYSLTAFTLTLLAITFTFTSDNHVVLILCVFTLFTLITVEYLRKLISAFRKSSSLQTAFIKTFSAIETHAKSSFKMDETIKNLPVSSFDDKQIKTWSDGLGNTVIFNRFCLFAAKKLRDYQKSGMHTLSHVFTIMLLLGKTILFFGLINFGIFKIDPGNFKFNEVPDFFTFIYFSFNNVLFNSTEELLCASHLSKTFYMVQASSSLFLIAIFASVFISVGAQRRNEELEEAIHALEKQSKALEIVIRDEYKLESIELAIVELDRIKADAAKLVIKITNLLK